MSDDLNADFLKLTDQISRQEFEEYRKFVIGVYEAQMPADLVEPLALYIALLERGDHDLYGTYTERYLPPDERETFLAMLHKTSKRIGALRVLADAGLAQMPNERAEALLTHVLFEYSPEDLHALDQHGCLYRKSRTVRLNRAADRVIEYLKRPENLVHNPRDPVEVKLKAKIDPEIALACFGRDSEPLTKLVTFLCQGSVHVEPES
jgi:hypothetical protein